MFTTYVTPNGYQFGNQTGAPRQCFIGRNEGADLCCPWDTTSGVEACLICDDDGALRLVYLGSRNGVYFNRQPAKILSPRPIVHPFDDSVRLSAPTGPRLHFCPLPAPEGRRFFRVGFLEEILSIIALKFESALNLTPTGRNTPPLIMESRGHLEDLRLTDSNWRAKLGLQDEGNLLIEGLVNLWLAR